MANNRVFMAKSRYSRQMWENNSCGRKPQSARVYPLLYPRHASSDFFAEKIFIFFFYFRAASILVGRGIFFIYFVGGLVKHSFDLSPSFFYIFGAI